MDIVSKDIVSIKTGLKMYTGYGVAPSGKTVELFSIPLEASLVLLCMSSESEPRNYAIRWTTNGGSWQYYGPNTSVNKDIASASNMLERNTYKCIKFTNMSITYDTKAYLWYFI